MDKKELAGAFIVIGHNLMDPAERGRVGEMGLFTTTCWECILEAVELLEEML